MSSSLARDVRIAARALLRRPGFTAIALLTLALGIGANTAVFSVVNGILISRLPYREPERLVTFGNTFISNAELLYLQEHGKSFAGVAAYSPGWGMALSSGGEPVALSAAKVSVNFLPMLGVSPALGRAFADDESAPGKDHVALLDYVLWQGRFGGDRSVLGRAIDLDGQPYTVVGVLPRGFSFYSAGSQANLLLPITLDAGAWYHRGQTALGIARLSPGATPASALAELKSHVPAMQQAFDYKPGYGSGFDVVPLRDFLVGPVRTMLLVLLGAVGFIVLIAAANVGNLLQVRTSERRREIAVRVALGASRLRVARALALESVLLSSGGSAAGLVLAIATVGLLRGLLPPSTPRLGEIAIDGTVLAVCIAVGLAAGLLGVLPALATVRTDPQVALGSTRGGDAIGRGGVRLRGTLVAIEVALALVLVIGAGLMLRTLTRLSQVDPGFRADRAVAFQLQPTAGRLKPGAQTTEYFDRVMDLVRGLPGVTAVGGIHHMPMSGFNWWADIDVEGRPLGAGVTPPRAGWRIITGDYLRAMGIALVAGRAFEAGDDARKERVVLINEMLAKRLFPQESPLGRRISAGNATRGAYARIVGVISNVRHQGIDLEPVGELYLPLSQVSMSFLTIVARTSADPRVLARSAVAAVRGLDPAVPISNVRTLEDVVRAASAPRRLVLQLLTAFAALGLALGAIGVYGVASYTVTQRTQEIGVRMALGAQGRSIVSMVLRHDLRYAGIGLIVGTVGAIGLTRAMRGVVYGVSTTDPVTYVGVALLVLGVSVLATAWPAWRAAHMDPVVAMRREG
jgi:predicted permease